LGAFIPICTWLPRTPRTVTWMSSPMFRVSPTRRVKISILATLRCLVSPSRRGSRSLPWPADKPRRTLRYFTPRPKGFRPCFRCL